jgi:hypothetical protein
MLKVFLSGSGGEVQIPDAVAVVDGDPYSNVHIVDAQGRTLVVFQRADLLMFSANPELHFPRVDAGVNGAGTDDLLKIT